MYILAEPLAYLTRLVYGFINNYGLTLIVVTILIRILTIPLTIKSQRSNAKTQALQPEIQRLQQKYKNDKEKLGMEMQKLYTKNGVNPMGGCLPLIVQMFVLFGFIRVVYDPLKYLLQLSADQINAIKEAVGINSHVYQVTLCGMEGVKEQLIELGKTPINFDFLGVDLTKMLKGSEGDILLWIFPVLATLVTILSAYISKKEMGEQGGGNEQAKSMSNSMMMIMPIMTAYFTYTMPAGMSLYWFVSTLTQLIQQSVITKIVKKEKALNTEREGKK